MSTGERSSTIEAMKQALDALDGERIFTLRPDHEGKELTPKKVTEAITALRTAIEQAEKQRFELIGHADLSINNIYTFSGYGEEVPEGRTPIYAGYKKQQPATRPATREEKIVNPGVYEVPVHDEFPLRGILASELKCWHRLTEEEQANLLAFVNTTPPYVATPLAAPAPEVRKPEPVQEPATEDEMRRAKPVCADFVSFRAGVRYAEARHKEKQQ